LRAPPFTVVGEPLDLATGVLDGVGQDGVLGGGELDGAHLMLLQVVDGVVMNALFSGEAKRLFDRIGPGRDPDGRGVVNLLARTG